MLPIPPCAHSRSLPRQIAEKVRLLGCHFLLPPFALTLMEPAQGSERWFGWRLITPGGTAMWSRMISSGWELTEASELPGHGEQSGLATDNQRTWHVA